MDCCLIARHLLSSWSFRFPGAPQVEADISARYTKDLTRLAEGTLERQAGCSEAEAAPICRVILGSTTREMTYNVDDSQVRGCGWGGELEPSWKLRTCTSSPFCPPRCSLRRRSVSRPYSSPPPRTPTRRAGAASAGAGPRASSASSLTRCVSSPQLLDCNPPLLHSLYPPLHSHPPWRAGAQHLRAPG